MQPGVFWLIALFFTCSCNDKPDSEPLSLNCLIYPSPANDYVHIAVRNPGSVENNLYVFNVSGQTVLSEIIPASTDKTFMLDLSDEEEGYFHVVLDTGKGEVVQKFLLL